LVLGSWAALDDPARSTSANATTDTGVMIAGRLNHRCICFTPSEED
jgi:hypothetical protein